MNNHKDIYTIFIINKIIQVVNEKTILFISFKYIIHSSSQYCILIQQFTNNFSRNSIVIEFRQKITNFVSSKSNEFTHFLSISFQPEPFSPDLKIVSSYSDSSKLLIDSVYPRCATRHTPRSERLPAIFEEIESATHSLVTHAIKNRSVGEGRRAQTSINEIVVASPIHPSSAHTVPYSSYSGSHFHPSSTYVAFLKSSAAISPQG